MKKPKKFPHEHQAGGLVFRISDATQIVPGKGRKSKRYESYLVSYYIGAQRVQKRANTWAKVEAIIEDVAIAHRQQDPERLELTGVHRRAHLAALEALQDTGKSVDEAASDFAAAQQVLKPHNVDVRQAANIVSDALKRLAGVSVSTVVDFYLQHGKSIKAYKTVPEVIEEFVSELKKNGRSNYHINNSEQRLSRFAQSFPGRIDLITEQEISHWLQSVKKKVWHKKKFVELPTGKPVSPKTRNNYRDAIFALFKFAQKRRYLPKGLPTEAADTDRVRVVAGENHIIKPAEADKLLKCLPPHLIPFATLKLFSGLRTEEAFNLRWEHLKFASGAVVIGAGLAKLRQRRAPPILPNLAKWLAPFEGLSGSIHFNHHQTPQSLQQAVTKRGAAKKVGVILKRNTFRNCYISYRVAQPTLPAIVAEEAGNSVRTIKSNYLELATKEEAAQWFAIEPTKEQLTELEAFAAEIKAQQIG